MTQIEKSILRKLNRHGPAWKRSYQPAKGAINHLVRQGFIQPVSPGPGLPRNMIAITPAGIHAIGEDR